MSEANFAPLYQFLPITDAEPQLNEAMREIADSLQFLYGNSPAAAGGGSGEAFGQFKTSGGSGGPLDATVFSEEIFIEPGTGVAITLTPGAANANVVTIAADPANIDHGALFGLGDDDHPQYAEHAGAETITGVWTFSTQPVGIDHGALAGLADDDHLQYALLAGRAGGQFLYGGLAAGDILDLQGADNSPDVGRLRFNSPITYTYDTISNTTPAESFVMRWGETFTAVAAYVGGMLTVAPQVTISTGVFIPATFSDTAVYMTAAAPGFSAYTWVNQLTTIENSGNFNLMSGLVANVGLTHARTSSGTSTTAGVTGVSLASQTRAEVSGAVMTRTGITGIAMRPTFSTVGGSTVNLGTIVGCDLFQPAVALFQPQAGVENMTAYYGIRHPNMTFGGANRVVNSVNSALVAATNVRCINHTGTALSDFGGSIRITADLVGLILGASQDLTFAWAGGTNTAFMQFNTLSLDQLHFGNPDNGRVRLEGGAGGASLEEITLDFARFHFGAPGTVGNQIGLWTAPATTVGLAGGFAQYLLTQGGNLNLGVLAMSDVSAWVVNAPSFDNSAYSITQLATFRVGGMTTSNPGGTVTERAAFWSTGRFLQRGSVQYPPINPATLAAGNNNDWAGLLTGSPNNNTRRWARVDPDGGGTSVITGIDATAVQDGDTFDLTNIGTVAFALGHQDANSAAGNRIISPTGANYSVAADETVTVRYDSTTARFRILESAAA